MRRYRRDPKHVRDFFYRHALSVRILTLIFDGIWWLISQGFVRLFRLIGRRLYWLLPFRFPVDERLRRFHSFIVGKTGVGKSVLIYHLIRQYLTR